MEGRWLPYHRSIRRAGLTGANGSLREIAMAKNTDHNYRRGAVDDRSQFQNPKNGDYVKRNSDTGRFMDVKTDGKPFKGVRREKP